MNTPGAASISIICVTAVVVNSHYEPIWMPWTCFPVVKRTSGSSAKLSGSGVTQRWEPDIDLISLSNGDGK